MMLYLYVTLGFFLLLAIRNPWASRSVIASCYASPRIIVTACERVRHSARSLASMARPDSLFEIQCALRALLDGLGDAVAVVGTMPQCFQDEGG